MCRVVPARGVELRRPARAVGCDELRGDARRLAERETGIVVTARVATSIARARLVSLASAHTVVPSSVTTISLGVTPVGTSPIAVFTEVSKMVIPTPLLAAPTAEPRLSATVCRSKSAGMEAIGANVVPSCTETKPSKFVT
jgi:hypothetical protein